MSQNSLDQVSFGNSKLKLINKVNPFEIMPFLVDVLTPADIQMLTQKTKDNGNPFGMMELLDKYANKARNLDSLIKALKRANYPIEHFFEEKPEPATQTEKKHNVEAMGAESFTTSELREQMKLMQEQMKGMQMELSHVQSAKDGERRQREYNQLCKDLKKVGVNLEEVLMKGGLTFPSKSILLVGGMNNTLNPLLEVYSTEDESKSRDLHINSTIHRSGHVGCKIGPKILISGGFNVVSTLLKSTEFFDIQSGQWSNGPDMNEGRFSAMSAPIDDAFFVFGGGSLEAASDEWVKSAETLRISCNAANKWQSIKDMPHKFMAGNAVAVQDQIYIIGANVERREMSLLIYVPAYDQYIPTIPPMGQTKGFCASALLNDNTIVVTGGLVDADDSKLNSCQMFDIRTEKWGSLSDMNIARFSHQLVNIDEKLYAIGGDGSRVEGEPEWLSSVEMFDIRNNKWMNVHPIKQPRAQFTAFAM